MPITNKPWSGDASKHKDARSYAKASLINLNTGDPKTWTKDKVKLPVYEPDGSLNRNGVHSAAAALAGARGGVKGVSPAMKKSAARKLMALYRQIKDPVPDSLKALAD